MCPAGGQHPDFTQIAQGTTKGINKLPARITQQSRQKCCPGPGVGAGLCNEQEGWDCTDECKMSPGKGHPEKAGANQQCQERTVGKLVMTAETTLLGCKSPWKKERGEDVGLGQKWLSLDVWGLVCGT